MLDEGAFDEAWYLDRYPDVRGAVADGHFASGEDHFARCGYREGRDARCASTLEVFNIAIRPPSLDAMDVAREVWSVSPQEQAQASGWYWMAHPAVRARTNEMASGRPGQDGYDALTPLLKERGIDLPIPASLSLGCGFGGLERDLASRGFLSRIDAYDLSEKAVLEASRLAGEAGFGWINYQTTDLELFELPANTYDVVFAHQSVHHVEHLDRLFERVSRAMTPKGLFHLNEFVGPDRFQWTDAQIELVNGFLASLPDDLRRTPSGRKPDLTRPTVEAMIQADPTEAVRSSEIMPALRRHFRIVLERPYGGTLLHLGLGDIAQNFDPADPEHAAILRGFFEEEDRMLRSGRIESDFVVVVAERA